MTLRTITGICIIALAHLIKPAFADSVPDNVGDAIRASLQAHLDGANIDAIETTPMAGVYRVSLGQGQYLYSSEDGSYMIAGEMYDFGGEQLVNLAEADRKSARENQLENFDVKTAITFAPEGETKAVLNVFTDVDCGYCQLFHQQVPALNRAGVEVRYLAYPRGGLTSAAYPKMVTAWCSKNPQQTLTALKNQEKVAIDTCQDNPVLEQFRMGNEFGVRGTPSLVLMDGTLIPGYKPAKELLVDLGLKNPELKDN